MRSFDLAVVGAGIAGLAIAEIFARSGHRVVLIEKNDVVCGETSGSHHAWFHFGSLYSIFPNNQFMRTLVGGIDDLLDYYRDFPGLNFRADKAGKLCFDDGKSAWIRDEPIQYLVAARNDADFALDVFEGANSYLRKLFFTLTWDLTIKQFISRHQRFEKFDWRSGPASQYVPKAGWLDYSRDVIFKVGDIDVNLDKNTHFRVQGFDRPMNAEVIVGDLLHGFLSAGGEIRLRTECMRFDERSGPVQIETTNGAIAADRVLFAAGSNLARLLADKLKVNVVASPLLVVYPSVCSEHFVRLTPTIDRTVNHLLHPANGKSYSLIGGGYSADPESPEQLERCKTQLLEMAERVLPKVKEAEFREPYVSYKTEVKSRLGERNYQYLIKELSERTFAVVPGKFSLGFSLAVNAYRRLMGRDPARRVSLDPSIDVESMVAPMRHRRMVEEFIGKERGAREGRMATGNVLGLNAPTVGGAEQKEYHSHTRERFRSWHR
jgi:glycine/D-amino acid oxidase-like deaminating enzyme